MVKQHIYLRGAAGGRVVAASADIQYGYWPTLLARHADLYGEQGADVPAYGQYRSERGIVLSRCAPDPDGGEDALIAHQLLFDEPDDIDWLTESRPLDGEPFVERYPDPAAEIATLPKLDARSLVQDEALSRAFQALHWFFGASPELLSQFIASLKAVAADPYRFLVVYVDDAPRRVTGYSHMMMEIMLRCLPAHCALRLGYRSFWIGSELSGEFPVVFTVPGGVRMTGTALKMAIRFYIPERFCAGYDGLPVETDAQDRELAQAMLAHDLNWVDRVRIGSLLPERPADSVRLALPPFERGMSLMQYVCDWIEELDQRRSQIDDRALNLSVVNWGQLESRIISAVELAEVHMDFLRELDGVIGLLAHREPDDWLKVPAETLSNLMVILIDSIRWVNVDIYEAEDQKFIKKLCGYERALRAMPDLNAMGGFELKLDVLRLIGSLLEGAPDAVEQGVQLLSRLGDGQQVQEIQSCLNWYVDRRCREQRLELKPDSLLAGAMILGNLRFTESGPVLRQANQLQRLMGKHCGEPVLESCQQDIDRLLGELPVHIEREQKRKEPRSLRRIDRRMIALYVLAGLAALFGLAAALWYLIR